jgi:uncharacterized protein
MSDPQSVEPAVPFEPQRDRDPFWTWGDAGLFLSLLLPSGLLALALTRGAFLLMKDPPGEGIRSLTFQFLGYGIWFGTLWLMLKFRYERPFWQSMAWNVPWPKMALTIFLGPILVFVVVVLGQVLKTPVIDSPIQRLFQSRWSLLLVGFFATTLGPLAEELVFRGFLQPLLIRTFGAFFGILLASAPFALLHGPQYSWSWQHIVLLFLASVVFGVTRFRTGSTAASTMVHATYNLTFFTGYLLQRKELFF